jgi:hypothetical protein
MQQATLLNLFGWQNQFSEKILFRKYLVDYSNKLIQTQLYVVYVVSIYGLIGYDLTMTMTMTIIVYVVAK